MATFAEKLQVYRSALAEAQANGDEVVARKIQQQISELQSFQERHPEDVEAPSPFEVFCDLNPSNIQCRVYDD